MPVIEHRPWVLRNMPIPPGIYDQVCKIIKTKIDTGVYERLNSSYQDGLQSLRKEESRFASFTVSNHSPYNILVFRLSQINSPSILLVALVAASSISM
jgi:hypothetical protein